MILYMAMRHPAARVRVPRRKCGARAGSPNRAGGPYHNRIAVACEHGKSAINVPFRGAYPSIPLLIGWKAIRYPSFPQFSS